MKRKIVIAAVTAAVLAGGGAATAVALAGDDSNGGDARTSAGSSTASGDAARVAVGDAARAAVRAVPGTVTEAELDDEDGRLVWELDVYGSDKAWHDVTVDPGNGRVLGKHVDNDDDGERHAPRKTSVTLDQAVGAALGSAPGTVTSIELEDHDGRSGGAVHWEVDVRGKDGSEHELNVDAKTAKVSVDRSHDGHGDDDGNDRDDD
ncbi:PepSY domain-containing protein [Streptomyces laculatispora]|uniref:PepSY domain-containing protein n=1 Tax=Streptomyces laculatispora TaxID=887464 RepID=UPI001A941B81|nr:PepSY domain-containing protein [Streptomyces laculatispora]MBO0918459.1 PepSY domain-containing protein [Streptomyces laculatispora]